MKNRVKMSADRDCPNKQKAIDNLYKLMIKFALLASICIISSLILYPLLLYTGIYGSYFSLLDDLNNSICILS